MLNHLRTYKAGDVGYYTPRSRGTVDVWYDSKRYVYKAPGKGDNGLSKFKAALLFAFGDTGRCSAKISGSYPSYTIETQG